MLPSVQLNSGAYRAGGASLLLDGHVFNPGDFAWPLTLQWELPATSQSDSQPLNLSPRSATPIQWTVPGPPALPSGSSPFSASLTGSPLAFPIVGQSSLDVVTPLVTCQWPDTPPTFRHDQDGSLSIQLICSGLGGPVEATLDATMTWEGGSAAVASAQGVLLNPAQPAVVSLTLPVPQMPAPGPLTVTVMVHAAEGSISQSWTGTYRLGGPAYSGGFSGTGVMPGGVLAGQIVNTGSFEGNPSVYWNLEDSTGMRVTADNWAVAALPIGGTLALSGTIPTTALPGDYTSWLRVENGSLAEPIYIQQDLTVTGTMPTVTLGTDRDLYGTADPVALTLHIEDAGHHLDAASAHLEVQRYLGPLGSGGTAGTQGASWGTPCTDGSGSFVVSPSSWFVDPSGTETVAAVNVRDEVPVSQLPPVAHDIDGDGKADFMVLRDTDLIIASEGDPGAGLSAMFLKQRAGRRLQTGEAAGRLRRPSHARVANRTCGMPSIDSFNSPWLALPVKATWGQPGDAWTKSFLLGVRDDGAGPANPLVLGLNDPGATTGTVLLVRMDGTVLWRHEFAAPFTPAVRDYSRTQNAAGPIFVDLNGDGVKDVLFASADALISLDGGSGELLWSHPLAGAERNLFRAGLSTTGPKVWIAFQTEQGAAIALLDAGGNIVYQTNLGSESLPTTLVTSDLDGDGNDEAVTWQWGWPSVQIFSVSNPTPILTAVPPLYSELALADINSDGKAEGIFAIQGPVSNDIYPLSVQVMDLLTGETKWVSPLPATASGYPVNFGILFVYADQQGTKKLLFEVPSMEGDPYRWFFIDPAAGYVEQAIEHSPFGAPYGSIVAGDFDGDGLSEFYEDGVLLDSACLDTDGTPIPCEGWQTVWAIDVTIVEGGTAAFDLNFEPGVMTGAGAYRATATVATPTNQSITAAPRGFTVSLTSLGLSLSPPAGTIVRSDEALTGTASLTNLGTASESNLTLTLLADGQVASTWILPSLNAGAREDFAFTLTPSAPGGHTLELEAVDNGAMVARVKSGYDSAAPQVTIDMEAPSSHTDAPFTLTVYSYNEGVVPVHYTIALSDDPSNLTALDLQPQGIATTNFTRQALGPYSSQLVVTGDTQQTIPVSVPTGYQLVLSTPDPGPQPAGTVLVPVHIVQSGPLSYTGSLTTTATPALGAPFITTWPVQVGPGGSADVTLALPIAAPGTAHLNIRAESTPAILDRDLSGLPRRDRHARPLIFHKPWARGWFRFPSPSRTGCLCRGALMSNWYGTWAGAPRPWRLQAFPWPVRTAASEPSSQHSPAERAPCRPC